jgi:hypothetical protein
MFLPLFLSNFSPSLESLNLSQPLKAISNFKPRLGGGSKLITKLQIMMQSNQIWQQRVFVCLRNQLR